MALFICNNCGYGSASWMGRCPDCGQWNTFVEKPEFGKGPSGKKESIKKMEITSLSKIKPLAKNRQPTGIYEFDRVVGGGVVRGEVILLTGEPGVGKSTLVLQTLHKMKTLYISGEESAEQVKDRAERLRIDLSQFYFSDNLQVEGIIAGVEDLGEKPDVMVIDSIQTVYSKDIETPAGSISQLKEAASRLISLAKKQKVAIILIGHITKGGEIAGPKTLEHFVDCVLDFEGERLSNFRLLRASKNRFGPSDEIGIFEMRGKGLVEVSNPLVFVDDKHRLEVGKAIVGVAEGKRPFFFEIQTLVSPSMLAVPRRVVKGLDYNKVLLLLAVVRKQLNLPIDRYDIYVNIIGGVNVKSPAADLGLIASLISSFKNITPPKNSLFIGEVGLLGEVRHGYFEDKIIKEASRLGFKKIYSSINTPNIKLIKKLFI